jgi:hypothetical protein
MVRHLTDRKAEIVRASPLYYYYALEGLMKAGATDAALQQMRDLYAPMVEASDAPTIWETSARVKHFETPGMGIY